MKNIGVVMLIILYKKLMDSSDMMNLFTISTLKIPPSAISTTPIHIFIEFFADISLFLKNE
ncbi:MAG: hypothetical protein ACFFFB_27145 [Candidatus Heimdallarchaeota archaeon]